MSISSLRNEAQERIKELRALDIPGVGPHRPEMNPTEISTWTGKVVNPLKLTPADICIEDIAHALSNQCRFSGHVDKFYSVADHSSRVSDLLGTWGHSRYVKLWGLLHDATEAYLIDLPRPLKDASTPLGAFYRLAEATAMQAVCQRFGLVFECPLTVKAADNVLLRTEKRDLMTRAGLWPSEPENLPVLEHRIFPCSPGDAELFFIHRFNELRLD